MNTAFITGSTSGIGLEFAKLLDQQGYQLILHGRSEQKLAQLASQLSHVKVVLVADLGCPEGQQSLITQIEALNTPIDVAINNAGLGLTGHHCDLPEAQIMNMLQVNQMAMMRLSHYFGRTMAQRGRGKILNVASTAAYQPQPFMAAYAASKAFVSSFSEALAMELMPKGVTVTVLSPGLTDTGFFTDEQGQDVSAGGTFNKAKRRSPRVVAEQGWGALIKGKIRHIALLENRLLVQLNRILPRNTVLRLYHRAMANL